MAISVRVPSMGQIDMFENNQYSKGLCTEKNSKETATKKCKYERTMNTSPEPQGIK